MSTWVESPAAASQWWQVGDAELRTALTDVHTAMRRNYHTVLEIIHEADSRGLAGSSGYPNLPVLLADMLRIPRAHATQCVEQARLVIQAGSITGVDVAPPLPRTGQALAAGVIGADHVASIAVTMAALPDWVDAETRDDVEATLVRTAHSADARTIAKLGRMILERLDQDGPEPRESDLSRQPNEQRTHTTRGGRMRFNGDIDAAETSKPKAPRWSQNYSAHWPNLAPPTPPAATHGARQSGWGMRSWTSCAWPATRTCPAKAVRNPQVVLGSYSEPLDIGRAERNIPLGMRRALVHRDGGCAFPYCDRPPNVVPFPPHSLVGRRWTYCASQLGACSFHHRLLHFSEWEVAIVNGRPEFYPPPFLDPQRNPLINHLHHRLE